MRYIEEYYGEEGGHGTDTIPFPSLAQEAGRNQRRYECGPRYGGC